MSDEDEITRPGNSDHKLLKELRDNVGEIMEILGGGLEKQGLVHIVRQMTEDCYGKETGIVHRLSALENQRAAAKAWLAGAFFVATGVGGVIVWIADKLVPSK